MFDVLLRTLAEAFCPPGNIMPPSLYLVEKLMQTRSTDSCSYHACPKDHHIWPHLPRSDWQGHVTDCCPVPGCGHPRFITATVAGTPCLRPSKVRTLCTVACTSKQLPSDFVLVSSCPFPVLLLHFCPPLLALHPFVVLCSHHKHALQSINHTEVHHYRHTAMITGTIFLGARTDVVRVGVCQG